MDDKQAQDHVMDGKARSEQRRQNLGAEYRRKSPIALTVFLAFTAFAVTWAAGAITLHIGYQYGKESTNAISHVTDTKKEKGQSFKTKEEKITIPTYHFETEEKTLTLPVQQVKTYPTYLQIPMQSVAFERTPSPAVAVPVADPVELPAKKSKAEPEAKAKAIKKGKEKNGDPFRKTP